MEPLFLWSFLLPCSFISCNSIKVGQTHTHINMMNLALEQAGLILWLSKFWFWSSSSSSLWSNFGMFLIHIISNLKWRSFLDLVLFFSRCGWWQNTKLFQSNQVKSFTSFTLSLSPFLWFSQFIWASQEITLPRGFPPVLGYPKKPFQMFYQIQINAKVLKSCPFLSFEDNE